MAKSNLPLLLGLGAGYLVLTQSKHLPQRSGWEELVLAEREGARRIHKGMTSVELANASYNGVQAGARTVDGLKNYVGGDIVIRWDALVKSWGETMYSLFAPSATSGLDWSAYSEQLKKALVPVSPRTDYIDDPKTAALLFSPVDAQRFWGAQLALARVMDELVAKAKAKLAKQPSTYWGVLVQEAENLPKSTLKAIGAGVGAGISAAGAGVWEGIKVAFKNPVFTALVIGAGYVWWRRRQ